MAQFYNGLVVYHHVFGTGRIVNVEADRIMVNFIKHGIRDFETGFAEEELSDTPFDEDTGSLETADDSGIKNMKDILRDILKDEGLIGNILIGQKWEGGELVLRPGKPGLQEKSLTIDTFFHKIVMIRNQLRMLEQNINSSTSLSDREKVDMQQYITRCYGSLTSFNVLFSDKKDWFIGSKKE